MRIITLTLLMGLGLISSQAQDKKSPKKDSTSFSQFKGLPLKATRSFDFTTNEGTWTSLAVSPDGKTILFDLMGDIYSIPMEGGKQLLSQRAWLTITIQVLVPMVNAFYFYLTVLVQKIYGT
jgi:hypothetical protein